jgi:hypothetical protein
MLGIRILARVPGEAEFAEDYTILWSYEGPSLFKEEGFSLFLKRLGSSQDLWNEGFSLVPKALEGPNVIEQLETVLETMDFDDTHDYIVQIKKMENGAYVWKTTELLEP